MVQIHSDEICLLVPPSHTLAKGKSVVPEEIAQHPLLLPKGGRTRSRINEYLDIVEDDLKISMEMESSEIDEAFRHGRARGRLHGGYSREVGDPRREIAGQSGWLRFPWFEP